MNAADRVCVECDSMSCGYQVGVMDRSELMELLQVFKLPYNVTSDELIQVYGPTQTFELHVHKVH